MFTERELLIMSYCVDVIAAKGDERLFFSPNDAKALCYKIHNVLRATRHAERELAGR